MLSFLWPMTGSGGDVPRNEMWDWHFLGLRGLGLSKQKVTLSKEGKRRKVTAQNLAFKDKRRRSSSKVRCPGLEALPAKRREVALSLVYRFILS